jgi:hypothetical protein
MVATHLPIEIYSRCLDYDRRRSEARINNGPPVGPPPEGYYEYLMGEDFNTNNNYRPHSQPIPDDQVRMPADTLAMIVRALGQTRPNQPTFPPPRFPRSNPTPRPPPRPRFDNPHKPNRGGKPNNRRPRRNNNNNNNHNPHLRTEDPRRRTHNINAPGPSRTSIPINMTNQPTPPDVPINEDVTEDLSFLNEFANADLSAFEEEMMENAGSPMEAGNVEL